MKHIVTLTISNPSHEHISLRRRQSTTNYMVEARDEAEAIFRASNHFKKLGNYVHNAVIAESVVNEEYNKNFPLGAKMKDAETAHRTAASDYIKAHGGRTPGAHAEAYADATVAHHYGQEAADRVKSSNEKIKNQFVRKPQVNEQEQIDEDDLSVRTLYNKYTDNQSAGKSTKPVEKAITKVHGSKVMSRLKLAAKASLKGNTDSEDNHFEKARTLAGGSDRIGSTVGRNRSAFRKSMGEEVEQIDESVKVGPKNYDEYTDTIWHGVHHNGKEIGTIGTNSAQHVEKHGKWGFEDSRGYGRRHGEPEMNSQKEALQALLNRHKEYAKKKTNEEVEQIDELSSGLVRRYGGKAIRASLEARAKGDTATAYKRAKGVSLASAKAFPNQYKNSPDKAKVPATNEEVEQIDELSKGTLASYIAKAAPKIRSNTFLKGHFEGQKYGHLKTVRKHSPNVNPNRKHERDPKKKEYAELLAKSAGDLSDKFALKAGNKITGIQRAAAKLAKEEVELDEANARHSPEAAQAVLTPTAKIVRAAVGKTARDKAAAKKYARRVAKISPDYSKKDVMDHLKSIGEEVEQIDELAPGTYRAAAEKRRQQADDIIISNNKFGIDNSRDDLAASDSLLNKADKLSDAASRRNRDRLFNAAQAQKNAALSAATKRLLKVNTKPRFTKANEEVEQLDELRPATYWNAAKKRNLQADRLPDNSTGSTDSAAQRIYKMANKLHNAGQKRAVDREENAKIDHVAATLSPATRKKLGINTNHQFTKADGTVVRKEEVVNEKAPPGAKYERMVKHIKDKYSEDGALTPQEKAIAYATAWKAKNAGK